MPALKPDRLLPAHRSTSVTARAHLSRSLSLAPVSGWGTDGTSSVIKHYGGASIISSCPSSGLDGAFRIRPGTSSSLAYVYSTAPSGGNQQSSYYYVKGLNIYNHSGAGHATTSGVGAYITSPSFDGSLWTETDVFDDLDPQPAVVHGGCCSSTWTHSSISGNYSGTPLTLLTDSTAGAGVVSFDFAYMTIVHPGPGLPAILCTDNQAHTSVANFNHIYTETSNTDTTTGLYKVDGCGTVSFNHIAFRSETAGISSPGIVVTTTYNSNVHVEDVTFTNGSGSFLLPAKAIQNSKVPAALNQVTDSLGHYGLYTNAPSALGILNQNSWTAVRPRSKTGARAPALPTTRLCRAAEVPSGSTTPTVQPRYREEAARASASTSTTAPSALGPLLDGRTQMCRTAASVHRSPPPPRSLQQEV